MLLDLNCGKREFMLADQKASLNLMAVLVMLVLLRLMVFVCTDDLCVSVHKSCQTFCME